MIYLSNTYSVVYEIPSLAVCLQYTVPTNTSHGYKLHELFLFGDFVLSYLMMMMMMMVCHERSEVPARSSDGRLPPPPPRLHRKRRFGGDNQGVHQGRPAPFGVVSGGQHARWWVKIITAHVSHIFISSTRHFFQLKYRRWFVGLLLNFFVASSWKRPCFGVTCFSSHQFKNSMVKQSRVRLYVGSSNGSVLTNEPRSVAGIRATHKPCSWREVKGTEPEKKKQVSLNRGNNCTKQMVRGLRRSTHVH